jgi:hypothetical protein
MTFGQVRLMFSAGSMAVFWGLFMPGYSLPSFTWGDPPVSVLASKCERLWIEDARNDPALECYLTSQRDRLCRETEKEHLIWFVSRYEQGKAAYDAKLWSYLLGIQKGMVKPGATEKDGKAEDTLKKYTRVSREEALRLKADDKFVKAVKIRTLTDMQLTAMLRRLAEKGYVASDDFGWSKPYWVEDAFAGELKVNPACKSPAA